MSVIQIGQSQTSFTASANPEAVYVGEILELEFSLINGNWGEFELPDLGPFQIISGPGRSFRTSIVNGQTERRTSYTYRVRATEEGNFRLQPAKMYTGGLIFKSNTVDIMVLEAVDKDETSPEIFLKARLSCDSCYLGQQITLDLELYTRTRITDFAVLNEPSFPALQSRRLTNIRNFQTTRDTLNGQLFNKRVLRRYILFPQRAGEFGGQVFDMRIVEEDQNPRWRGFFRLGGEVHYHSVKVPTFWVFNQPPDAPDGFSGHIGNFELLAVNGNNQLKIGELMSLTLIMRGDGDPASMSPPHFDKSGGLHLSDIRLNREDVVELDGRLRTTREWQALFRADSIGEHSISPFLIAYDPVLDSFYRRDVRPSLVYIEPGEPSHIGMVTDESDAITTLDRKDRNIFRQPLMWTGISLMAVALFLFLFFRKRNTGEASMSAGRQLQKSLDEIINREYDTPKEHCGAILNALDKFISSLIELPMSKWEDANLKTELTKVVSADKVEQILEWRSALIAGTFGYTTINPDEIAGQLLDFLNEAE